MFPECLCLGWLSFTEPNLTARMKTGWYWPPSLLSLSSLALYMLFNVKIILDRISMLQGPK